MAIAVREGQRLKRAVVATSAEQAELRELRVTRRRRQSPSPVGRRADDTDADFSCYVLTGIFHFSQG